VVLSTERIGYMPKQLAARWAVDVKTIYKAIREGTIPAIKLGDRLVVTQPVIDRLESEGNLK